jgi:hypothetical protein
LDVPEEDFSASVIEVQTVGQVFSRVNRLP